MTETHFMTVLLKELETAINDNWLCPTDFDSHNGCLHSDFHSKMIGIISYVLQYHFSFYVKHELRLWGSFSSDLLAFRKQQNGFTPIALFEYESPNSYLHLPECPVGKDISHYFDFQMKCQDQTLSAFSTQFANVDWYIITTLPKHNVKGKRWNYKTSIGTKADISSFLNNPFNHMYKKYVHLFNNLRKKCKRPGAQMNNIFLINISVENNILNVNQHHLNQKARVI